MKQPAVYLLASQRNGTLYVGVTSHLIQRIWQHREGEAEGAQGDPGEEKTDEKPKKVIH